MRLAGYSGLLLGAVLLLLALFWLTQRRLIYFPPGDRLPAAQSLLPQASAVSFETEDGLQLGGWFVPKAGDSDGWTILVFNGNAGSRADRVALAAGFALRGFAVLLFDYRGYGGNPGSPSETGLLRDARAAREYLERRPEHRSDRLVYFGESLGAAVAVALAVEHPPAVLVLRSPFSSLVEVGKFHYPYLPVRSLLRDRFPSIDSIRRVGSPLFVVAGREDRVVPFEQSRALFEVAGSRDKRFLAIEGADHNDPALVAGADMLDRVVDFVKGSR